MYRLALFCGAAVALAAVAAPARAQVIQNGSFESPVVTSGSVTTVTGPGNTPGLPGWTVGPNSVDVVAPGAGTAPAANLRQYLDLDGTPGPGQISQTFTTVPGLGYMMSFSYANNPSVSSASA